MSPAPVSPVAQPAGTPAPEPTPTPVQELEKVTMEAPEVTDVQQQVLSNGDTQITYKDSQGQTQTITIHPAEEGNSTSQQSDKNDDSGAGISVGVPADTGDEYSAYMNMSAQEQYEYFQSFESPQAFLDWFNAAKAAYDAAHQAIEIGGGTIDLSGGNK